jgi:pimeloyl-ACP methyl ester carboxylesterase
MKNPSLAISSRRVLASLTVSLLAVSVSVALGSGTRAETATKLKVPNIVLVHGAWADGSSWGPVIQRLQKAGYKVSAVQLALASMEDDVARTRSVLAAQDGPTLLVAHSLGGAVITALGADAPNVVGLVYESAFAPDQGESLKGLTSSGPQPPGSVAIRPDKRGFLWLDRAGFRQYFAPDVAVDQERVMEVVQKPVAASELGSDKKFAAPAWRSLPTWFIVSENDQMIPPDAQKLFAKRMNATVLSLPGSHVLMVSHPDEVAGFIIKAAQSGRTKMAENLPK